MNQQFDNVQKFGKDQMDASLKAIGVLSKGSQAIATEIADYSKRSFEEGAAVIEKLSGVRSMDKVLEIQSEYVKNTYESLMAQTTRLGEMYADLAKEAFKPYEGVLASAKAAAESNVAAFTKAAA